MFNLLTQFGSSSGIGALGFSLSGFLIQLATFVIALLVLRQWAFKPIMKVMKERRDLIEKGVSLGLEMEKEKTKLEEKVSKTLHETRIEADKIIADAQNTSRDMVRAAEEDARSKSALILKAAEERAKQEVALAWHKLENQLAALVADATEAVVEEKVDERSDSILIDKAIKERIKE
jgi:F-type H+-transporting ATPase subunit b